MQSLCLSTDLHVKHVSKLHAFKKMLHEIWKHEEQCSIYHVTEADHFTAK